ncbi:MAG: NAD(P)/FAD-dependent oxidoreductase [Deltaproteobacteria bacterium]|nr:NAD(P)/FAD-dependent oxidoreductase [Deltaproteobacteria bacterium]MBW2138283.1 NAD(P)/FAD-dependent oxidoreductase [Deltaproteobacteria bacterium]
MKRYVIIGNGVAGTTAAENIRKHDRDGSITVLTDEDTPFYYRIRLNEMISGDITEKDLIARKTEWYESEKIGMETNRRATGADPERKILLAQDGQQLPYDILLIATGSHSFVPPIKGADKRGVFTLRSIQDARDISAWAQTAEEVVVIGGGLLGLESGNALRKLGKKVTVVEFFPRLLPRQLDTDGARRLQGIMEEMGFTFRLGAKTREITGEEKASEVRLEGGETLAADMVVISAGVRPNLELAEPLALEKDKGIKVDDHMRTNRPDVFAAGDVAEFKGIPYGIWPAAMEQGKIAGVNMAGGDLTYSGTTMSTTLKVVGIDLASAGDIDAENKFESRVFTDGRTYKKIIIDDKRIVGCIMLGDTKEFSRITKMMSEERDVSELNKLLHK